jgi:hypothetical protein
MELGPVQVGPFCNGGAFQPQITMTRRLAPSGGHGRRDTGRRSHHAYLQMLSDVQAAGKISPARADGAGA